MTATMTKKKTVKKNLPQNPNPNPAICVKIAKDVIKQLNMKNSIVATHGTYCRFNESDDDIYQITTYGPHQDSSAKKYLTTLKKKCEVCALGAMIISWVGFFNNLNIKNLEHENTSIWYTELSKAFSEDQLNLIEKAFENSMMDYNNNSYYDKYYNKYKTAKGRMTAIMQNIVENRGQFIY